MMDEMRLLEMEGRESSTIVIYVELSMTHQIQQNRFG
jgi:hypothetical protein